MRAAPAFRERLSDVEAATPAVSARLVNKLTTGCANPRPGKRSATSTKQPRIRWPHLIRCCLLTNASRSEKRRITPSAINAARSDIRAMTSASWLTSRQGHAVLPFQTIEQIGLISRPHRHIQRRGRPSSSRICGWQQQGAGNGHAPPSRLRADADSGARIGGPDPPAQGRGGHRGATPAMPWILQRLRQGAPQEAGWDAARRAGS